MSQGNSILDNVQWAADSGAITFKDVRYMLIRPDTVVDFQKAVEAEAAAPARPNVTKKSLTIPTRRSWPSCARWAARSAGESSM